MTLNMGPQHPSTHGVLRVVIELDGETITKATPDIGYLHTGIEKECEAKTYQQVVTLTDRVDYLANLSNNLCYALAVEKLLQLEIPAAGAVDARDAGRVDPHQQPPGLAGHARHGHRRDDRVSYCFREREDILRIFEMFSGQRMMTSYIRIGGLALEPPRGWQQAVGTFIRRISRPRSTSTKTCSRTIRSGCNRTKGVGTVPLDDLLDLRRDRPADSRPRDCPGISARASRTRATKSSISKCRCVPKTMCTRGTRCASKRCGRARESLCRRWKACRVVRGRPTRRTWCCPTAKR